MKNFVLAILIVITVASVAWAGDLTFITNATDAHNRPYKVYLDLSTKHMEGTYTTMTSYALWEPPISQDGYSGIKWYKNTFQIDCNRNVKRVTYIAYLDVNGKVIVDEADPNAPDEGFGADTVLLRELRTN